MNKARRKAIADVAARLEAAQAVLEELRSEIEGIREEEGEGYENLPESLQDGERGQAMQAVMEALEEAGSFIDDLDFSSITEALDRASE